MVMDVGFGADSLCADHFGNGAAWPQSVGLVLIGSEPTFILTSFICLGNTYSRYIVIIRPAPLIHN